MDVSKAIGWLLLVCIGGAVAADVYYRRGTVRTAVQQARREFEQEAIAAGVGEYYKHPFTRITGFRFKPPGSVPPPPTPAPSPSPSPSPRPWWPRR